MKPSFKLPIVRAFSTISLAAACALPCGASTVILTPIADAFVTTGPTGNLSSDNFGGAGALSVAASGSANGEFQSVIEFNFSSAAQTFNTQFGVGQWTIQSVILQLSATPNNNAIFNTAAAGMFGVSLMQNNSWAEGTGTPASPTTDGITFNTLQSTFINNAADQILGTFSYNGLSSGTNESFLGLTSGLTSDLTTGSDASLRLSAADSQVSFLFNSRSGGSSASHPELIINVIPEPSTTALGVTALATLSLWRVLGRRNRSR